MRRQRLLAAFATVALLALESVALAHEIEHELDRHNEPSCALHLFATGVGKTTATELLVVGTPMPASFDTTTVIPLRLAAPPLGYRGRAPPGDLLITG